MNSFWSVDIMVDCVTLPVPVNIISKFLSYGNRNFMILDGVASHRAHCMLVACSNMVMFITKNWYIKIGKDFDHIHKDYSADKGLQMLRNLIDSLNATGN